MELPFIKVLEKFNNYKGIWINAGVDDPIPLI